MFTKWIQLCDLILACTVGLTVYIADAISKQKLPFIKNDFAILIFVLFAELANVAASAATTRNLQINDRLLAIAMQSYLPRHEHQ